MDQVTFIETLHIYIFLGRHECARRYVDDEDHANLDYVRSMLGGAKRCVPDDDSARCWLLYITFDIIMIEFEIYYQSLLENYFMRCILGFI